MIELLNEEKPYVLYNDDCFNIFPSIPNNSIDLILCDPPYGVTKNLWDTPLPFEKLWKEYNRIIKDNGAILIFCQGKFMANLILSNPKMYRYDLVWNKEIPTGFLNANRMPLRVHEQIAVFYKHLPVYNPQFTEGDVVETKIYENEEVKMDGNTCYGTYKKHSRPRLKPTDRRFPTSIITSKKINSSLTSHPTEKPVKLLEWLIKSYTNEKGIVLDNTMGVGSTGVAAIKNERYFIGIELLNNFYKIAERRMEEEYSKMGTMKK